VTNPPIMVPLTVADLMLLNAACVAVRGALGEPCCREISADLLDHWREQEGEPQRRAIAHTTDLSDRVVALLGEHHVRTDK
jgi:hypothetical protein